MLFLFLGEKVSWSAIIPVHHRRPPLCLFWQSTKVLHNVGTGRSGRTVNKTSRVMEYQTPSGNVEHTVFRYMHCSTINQTIRSTARANGCANTNHSDCMVEKLKET